MMKKVFWFIEGICWSIRCKYKFWLHGPYGLASVIEILPFHYVKKYLIKYGASIGSNCVIDTGVIIHRPDKKEPFKNLIIGDNCYIGRKILFDLSEKIEIEHDVAIGTGCYFWTHAGDYKENLINRIDDYTEFIAPIKIKKCATFYSCTVVSPGVTIGEYSRIGSNSVVNRDVEPYTFVGGVPAKYIKSRKFD